MSGTTVDTQKATQLLATDLGKIENFNREPLTTGELDCFLCKRSRGEVSTGTIHQVASEILRFADLQTLRKRIGCGFAGYSGNSYCSKNNGLWI